MKFVLCKDAAAGAELAYGIVKKTLRAGAVLGLATGSTPLGLYDLMIKGCKEGDTYKDISTVNLDEYVGLPATHPQSYAFFMQQNLFKYIDIEPQNTHIPNGCAADLAEEAERYSALIAKRPQDIQILGIGSNGHIGFNEPAELFTLHTHVVTLEEGTRADNARFFDNPDDVPTKAITMGVNDILAAKKIVLLAFGAQKRNAIKALKNGSITPEIPATILHMHGDVTVITDQTEQ